MKNNMTYLQKYKTWEKIKDKDAPTIDDAELFARWLDNQEKECEHDWIKGWDDNEESLTCTKCKKTRLKECKYTSTACSICQFEKGHSLSCSQYKELTFEEFMKEESKTKYHTAICENRDDPDCGCRQPLCIQSDLKQPNEWSFDERVFMQKAEELQRLAKEEELLKSNHLKQPREECVPGNCPFAVDTTWPPKAWGMGPEGWESARIRHQNHCKHNICSNCGKEL